MKSNGLTRRRFIRNTALVAVPWVVPSDVLGRYGKVAPSNRIVMGCIGAGGMGANNLRTFMAYGDVQIVAVCDVSRDRRRALIKTVEDNYASSKRAGTYNGCAEYNDFQQMYARPDIDAVSITTPDHWHAIMTVLAARAGKDIYCEKPMAHSIRQGRAAVEVVTRYGCVFQHGTWRRSRENVRFACELVRNQRIGKLQTIKVGSKGGKFGGSGRPMPVPPGFDWDRWLGPAPKVSYSVDRWAGEFGKGWYYISDYAIGWIADWGIHPLDIAQWGNDTSYTAPVEVEGSAKFPREGLFDNPYLWDVTCKYANGTKMHFATVPEKYWDYTNTENKPGIVNRLGVVFEGADGWIYVGCYGELDASPRSLLNTRLDAGDIRLYKSTDHYRNFLDCVKSRDETITPVEVAHQSNTVSQLVYISVLLGRKIRWDPQNELFIGDDQANRLLNRPLRTPWSI